jgi:hypothetical protein
MDKINRWVASEECDGFGFPRWDGILPGGWPKEKYDAIYKQILDFARQEEIYRLVYHHPDRELQVLAETRGDFRFEFIELEDGKKYYMTEDGMHFTKLKEQTKISYYHQGEIVSNWVENIEYLAKTLLPENYGEPREDDRDSSNSIPVYFDLCPQDNGEMGFSIFLISDIWFPRVYGWWYEEEPIYDNTELAALNTPRLNRVIQQTKKLILELGGNWSLVNTPYNMAVECEVTENGINLEPNSKPRNYWCVWNTYGNISVSEWNPEWIAEFPTDRFKKNQDIWPLVKTILEVGYEEGIFQAFTRESDLQHFIQDVDSGRIRVPSLETIQRRGDITLTYSSEPNDFEVKYTPNYLKRISGETYLGYYDSSGLIRYDYVHQLGRICQQLHENRGFDDSVFRYYAPADGYSIEFSDPCGSEIYLGVRLPSDIWFPWVKGCLEEKTWATIGKSSRLNYVCRKEKHGLIYCKKEFDNRELANINTPRLNRFIAAIAKKTTEMGGKWSVCEEEGSLNHNRMMTPMGIILDL